MAPELNKYPCDVIPSFDTDLKSDSLYPSFLDKPIKGLTNIPFNIPILNTKNIKNIER